MDKDIPDDLLDYIRAKDAADKLGFSVQHTRLLIRQGKIRGVKIGRDWLVLKESVAEYEANEEGRSDE